jgi:DNA-binding CsgD family transcriptional regulator
MKPLTERELSVAELLADGRSRKEVAVRLGITISTVRAHIDRIYEKIGGRGRKTAIIVRYFTRNHLTR